MARTSRRRNAGGNRRLRARSRRNHCGRLTLDYRRESNAYWRRFWVRYDSPGARRRRAAAKRRTAARHRREAQRRAIDAREGIIYPPSPCTAIYKEGKRVYARSRHRIKHQEIVARRKRIACRQALAATRATKATTATGGKSGSGASRARKARRASTC